MIVVDASVVVEALVDDGKSGGLARERMTESSLLQAPELIDLEILSVLRRLVARGTLDAKRAMRAVDDMLDLAIVRYPHRSLTWRVWELRSNLTPYDASYVVLAEACECPLVTFDRAIARCPGLRCDVELLPS
jgi:predicted nucleic acid-binding protein